MKKNLNKDVVVGIHAVRILLKIRPYDVYEIYMVDKKLKILMICKKLKKIKLQFKIFLMKRYMKFQMLKVTKVS